ncbi:MAG: type II toxin-antitoxin system VapB family antitoxin [Pseudomonadales bacterium]|jgi:antitoxin VapB|nr:type II toxin-antitoxin system VapB family antitoxin [Pseudomonadales bacterium]
MLNIKNPATVALATELAKRSGQTKTAAIHQALQERLKRMGGGDDKERLLAEMRGISRRVALRPELDKRSAEDIIGYDEHGLPG